MRVYGDANPELTGTVSGLVNNDPITVSFATSAETLSDVGSYLIVATLD